MNNLITFVAKWERKYPILKKYRADRDIAYFTYMDFLCKCKGAYIRLTGLKGSIEEDDKNENIDAIRQVGTFPSGKCCHGRDRNNMCQENLSMQKLVIQEINISIKQR